MSKITKDAITAKADKKTPTSHEDVPLATPTPQERERKVQAGVTNTTKRAEAARET